MQTLLTYCIFISWIQEQSQNGKQIKTFHVHSRSGETVGNWVGNQLAAGCDTRLEWGYFQLPTQTTVLQALG